MHSCHSTPDPFSEMFQTDET
ncbi:predicted protein [Fibroporia radiculosa]|uniref:Uncharacterized protein n=1 Tax=Fibroporia radiculosa TaxID=599839 RepID=J4IC12_9APHY|nr:predicted protein [Fibroporia radiculosa]